MYLKKLHITNFRCFRDYTIEFAPGVTILFGKNGSGKSTLIHAIHKALSFAFNANGTLDLGAGFPDLKPNQYDKKEDLVRDPKTGLPYPFIDIQAEASFKEEELKWNMYASTSTFKLQPSKYMYANNRFLYKIMKKNSYPVFAYFSDSFPHVPSISASKLTPTQLSLRNLGYLGWDSETAYSDLWIKKYTQIWTLWNRANREVDDEEKRLRNCKELFENGTISDKEFREDFALHEARLDNALKEGANYEPEVSAIRNCLVKFTKGDPNFEILDLYVSIYDEEGLCLSTRDNRRMSFEKLPAGYKRILYMALDIAYRSYILNGTTDAHGVVIIDEIDLHLHPELEQIVLQRFTGTFPNVQFIVSTHSPLVLTGIETKNGNNSVLKMTPACDAPEEWRNIHGIDYNQMLEENMDVSKRKPEIEETFKKIWDAVAKKDVQSAKKLVEELEKITPADQTELVKLRALISRLEIIGR